METKKRRTKRRGNGEGSICQRESDGRWVAKITIGYEADGKRRRKTVYGKTKKEVQDKLLALQRRKMLGATVETKGIKVADYLARWLKDVARVNVCESTYVRYKELIDIHVSPRIGGLKLEALSAADIQQVYSEMEESGSSPRTRRFVHSVLRRALSQAVKLDLVARNVCTLVDPPKLVPTEMKTLTKEEANCFLDAAKQDRLYAMYVLALTTGMRQGELFALQWGDINLKEMNLSVRRTTTMRKKVKEPKTAKGKRRIELSAIAVDTLHEHRKRMVAEGQAASPWVFCTRQGGLLSAHNVYYRSYKPLLKKAGVPSIRFHDMRHTAATLLLLANIHVKIVSEMLGHSTIAITLDTYSHVLPSMGRDAANTMNSLLTTAAS
jgi:integrase